MKIIFGAWSPDLIIDLINNGVDMFDSSLPYMITERNSALVFDYNFKYKWDLLFYLKLYIYYTNNGIILINVFIDFQKWKYYYGYSS